MFKILNNAEDCKDWQNSKSVKKNAVICVY